MGGTGLSGGEGGTFGDGGRVVMLFGDNEVVRRSETVIKRLGQLSGLGLWRATRKRTKMMARLSLPIWHTFGRDCSKAGHSSSKKNLLSTGERKRVN